MITISLLLISLLLFLSIGCFSIFWLTSGYDECPWWAKYVVALCLIAAFFTFWGAISRKQAEHAAKDALEEAAWIANGCPVYKADCARGKATYGNYYPCEKKASAVGRNRVGEVFVEAYPTCKVGK